VARASRRVADADEAAPEEQRLDLAAAIPGQPDVGLARRSEQPDARVPDLDLEGGELPFLVLDREAEHVLVLAMWTPGLKVISAASDQAK
jgi:hypothetical protein